MWKGLDETLNGILSYPDEMLSIIQNGLQKNTKPKHVMILGAGMAGLVAGSLLKRAGHTVSILEGNSRVGGRIFTMRQPFSEGNYFEAGAMRIPETHVLVLELIKRFKLPLNPFINSTPYDIIYVNGILTRRYLYDKDPDVLKYPVGDKYKKQTALNIFLEAVQPFFDLYTNASPEERIRLKKKYDSYSFGSFLKNNPFGKSLDASTVHLIQILLGIEGFPELSFVDIITDIVSNLFSSDLKYYEIIGGNDRLPWSFMKELSSNLYLYENVTDIKQYDKSVVVSTVDPRTGKRSGIQADYAITTIPFSVFQFINIEPFSSISFEKRTAIQTMHYVPATKIGLEFGYKFWEKDQLFGGSMTTDFPLQFAYYPSHNIGKPGPGVMLGSYSWEDNAALWDALPEDRRIQEALQMLARVHGPVVFQTFRKGASFSWAQNPFSGGCFTLFKPYQYSEFGQVIKQPEGRLHFAGEHTSSFHGWIEGAIESGVRTAFEVNARD
ncbi:flavin monoamine oxidase family protein [Pseudalkalibacillus sp. Hm43]|uniref:flavin monoamine oxidase family protein n=1 Tax=Pseudalkalibacillus sp. Hm43 TaxID=3450742 RepID=UPI003F43EE6D